MMDYYLTKLLEDLLYKPDALTTMQPEDRAMNWNRE